MSGDVEPTEYGIVLRVGAVADLFNVLDPSPFRQRDLDEEADRFIVDWAREAPAASRFAIVLQLPGDEQPADQLETLQAAVRNHFDGRALEASRELRELFREGQRALMIGLPILAACLVVSQLLGGDAASSPWRRLFSESLIILGWVANWHPLELFLYGWWPIRRRRDLYRRLAAARVVLGRG